MPYYCTNESPSIISRAPSFEDSDRDLATISERVEPSYSCSYGGDRTRSASSNLDHRFVVVEDSSYNGSLHNNSFVFPEYDVTAGRKTRSISGITEN